MRAEPRSASAFWSAGDSAGDAPACAPQMTDVRASCRLLPSEPGVYRFRDRRGAVMYLGRATNLRTRTLSYWGDLAGRPHLRRMIPQITAVEALACASVHEASWLERNLLDRALPRWNRVRGGMEVPVWLVLDLNPRDPDLRLASSSDAHQTQLTPPGTGPDAVAYGPYLGAERAKLARSGLLRVWPLAATSTTTSAAARELARTRGVDCNDRAVLGARIGSALAGDPDAVDSWRSGLTAARDRAVSGLAFELAGRITAELDAIAWLVGPQRVTSGDLSDADVHGWHSGIHVHLQIRGGRMQRWQQVPTAAPPARALAATPAQWRMFAQLNAELASRISAPDPSPG